MSIKITTELVKELRDATGISVMQCKNALEEAGGDIEKALIILKKTSGSAATKRAERSANDGIVVVKQKGDEALILALHSETDFVARSEDFIKLANDLAEIAIEKGVEEAKEVSSDLINTLIQKVGEKIELGKIEKIKGSILNHYIHGNKSAVIVSLSEGSEELAKELAMHITAMKPVYIKKEDIDEKDKAKVLEVFEKEVADSDKPEEIKEKILEGKINAYFKEQTLMDQPYIKDPNVSIEKLLLDNQAKLDSFIHISI